MSALACAPLPIEHQRRAQGFPKALSALAKCEHTPLDADFLLFKCTFWQSPVPSVTCQPSVPLPAVHVE